MREDRYRPIREAFTRGGVVCQMWDKPGCGRSGGAFEPFRSYRARAGEVEAALRWLQRHDAVREKPVGLWGSSEGVWVSLLAAVEGTVPAFLILVSGPCRPRKGSGTTSG